MTDDHLSKRQQDRIAANRAERLAPWLSSESSDDGGETGVVVSHLRREVEVAPGRGGDPVRCFLRATTDPVVSGDRVLFERDETDPSRGVIVARLPRLALLSRHTPKGLRPVCANLDLLLITVAPEPAPHPDLIDRYLLAANLDELDAAIVINKADLDPAGRIDELLSVYPDLGVPVVRASALEGTGLTDLRALLAGRAAAFVGQSGVGKSSLINALVPDADADTGTLSGRRNRGRARGRHTTSTTRLYRTDDAVIIDSPGIREFVADIPDEAALAQGFPEIAEAAARCRFRDCRHDSEPDCAVRAKLTEGRIAASRVHSWRLLRTELAERGRSR